ncbi:MAG: hypothetical protein IT220_05530 [Flavobacteriaceae bacterium]|nr:hypothetical protein [Flavobacteriaceae bacterium]
MHSRGFIGDWGGIVGGLWDGGMIFFSHELTNDGLIHMNKQMWIEMNGH